MEPLVALTSVQGAFTAHVIAARLHSEGIDVELRGAVGSPYGLTVGDMARVDLYVPEDQMDDARLVLIASEVDDAMDLPEPRRATGAGPLWTWRLTKDVAPFLMVAERDEVPGFNVVGLKRRGFGREAIRELKECFRDVFAAGDPRKAAAARLGAGVASAEARRFLEFFGAGKRGFARPAAGLKNESIE